MKSNLSKIEILKSPIEFILVFSKTMHKIIALALLVFLGTSATLKPQSLDIRSL